MKHLNHKLTIAVAVAAATVSAGAAVATAVGDGKGTDVSHADVAFFAEPNERVGHSTLSRKSNEVKMSLKSSDLAGGHALTVWWVVFNEPENCSAPGCGEDDLFIDGNPANALNDEAIEAADIVVAYADGDVTSGGGQAAFHATLREGDPGRDVIIGDGAVLKDTRGAEIHLVVRSHGPVIPGLEDVQTGSFAGGCETFLVPPAIPDAEGECADVQFSVHLP